MIFGRVKRRLVVRSCAFLLALCFVTVGFKAAEWKFFSVAQPNVVKYADVVERVSGDFGEEASLAYGNADDSGLNATKEKKPDFVYKNFENTFHEKFGRHTWTSSKLFCQEAIVGKNKVSFLGFAANLEDQAFRNYADFRNPLTVRSYAQKASEAFRARMQLTCVNARGDVRKVDEFLMDPECLFWHEAHLTIFPQLCFTAVCVGESWISLAGDGVKAVVARISVAPKMEFVDVTVGAIAWNITSNNLPRLRWWLNWYTKVHFVKRVVLYIYVPFDAKDLRTLNDEYEQLVIIEWIGFGGGFYGSGRARFLMNADLRARFERSSTYLISMDVDEFLYLPNGNTIGRFAEEMALKDKATAAWQFMHIELEGCKDEDSESWVDAAKFKCESFSGRDKYLYSPQRMYVLSTHVGAPKPKYSFHPVPQTEGFFFHLRGYSSRDFEISQQCRLMKESKRKLYRCSMMEPWIEKLRLWSKITQTSKAQFVNQ
jgi:hypothetical protein